MRRRRFLAAGVAGLGLVTGAGCIGDLTVASEHRSLDGLGPESVLQVTNRNGDVTVHGEERSTGRVDVTKRTRRGVDLERVSVSVTEENELVRVSPRLPANVRPGWVSLDLTLSVPRRVAVDRVETGNGRVSVEDTGGDAILRSTNGDVRADSIAGVVTAGTSNGDVRVTDTPGVGHVRSVNGDVEAEVREVEVETTVETVNGDVEVAIAPTVECTLSASVTNGDIRVVGLDLAGMSSDRRSLNGRLGQGGPTLVLSTRNGSIEIGALD